MAVSRKETSRAPAFGDRRENSSQDKPTLEEVGKEIGATVKAVLSPSEFNANNAAGLVDKDVYLLLRSFREALEAERTREVGQKHLELLREDEERIFWQMVAHEAAPYVFSRVLEAANRWLLLGKFTEAENTVREGLQNAIFNLSRTVYEDKGPLKTALDTLRQKFGEFAPEFKTSVETGRKTKEKTMEEARGAWKRKEAAAEGGGLAQTKPGLEEEEPSRESTRQAESVIEGIVPEQINPPWEVPDLRAIKAEDILEVEEVGGPVPYPTYEYEIGSYPFRNRDDREWCVLVMEPVRKPNWLLGKQSSLLRLAEVGITSYRNGAWNPLYRPVSCGRWRRKEQHRK